MTKKKLVTRRELAQILGHHMSAVTKWEQSGMPCAEPGRKGKPSLYSELEVRKWLSNREKAAQKNGTVDLTRERALRERAQRISLEQIAQIRAGDLLPRAHVEKDWAADLMALRARFNTWPATIGDQLCRVATLKGLDAFKLALKDEIHALLNELSKRPWDKKVNRAKKITQAKKPRGSGSRKK